MTLHPMDIIARIDGAARGNPGPAAYGVVIENGGGEPLARLSQRLGKATNNFAEYQALLAALEYATQHQHRRVKVFSDSELLVRQMQGVYKVKSPDLKPLHERARVLAAQLESFAIEHVPREQNCEADRLANAALDAPDGRVSAPSSSRSSRLLPAEPLRAAATYHQGILKLHTELPLNEGETVKLVIHRPK